MSASGRYGSLVARSRLRDAGAKNLLPANFNLDRVRARRSFELGASSLANGRSCIFAHSCKSHVRRRGAVDGVTDGIREAPLVGRVRYAARGSRGVPQ